MNERIEMKLEFEPPFELTHAERISPLWTRLSAEIERKLNAARIKNDNPSLSDGETAALRGEIKCYKSILALGSVPPPNDE